MAKRIYKIKGTRVTIEDLVHIEMGYTIKLIDEATYTEYLENPLFDFIYEGGCIGDDEYNDDDIII